MFATFNATAIPGRDATCIALASILSAKLVAEDADLLIP